MDCKRFVGCVMFWLLFFYSAFIGDIFLASGLPISSVLKDRRNILIFLTTGLITPLLEDLGP